MEFRVYEETRDLKAIERIWFECGWFENAEQAQYLKDFLSVGHCLTAVMDGEPECAVHIAPGAIRYLDQDLSMCAVTAVTTSRVARKQGFAGRLTAAQVARGAADGAEIAALGMFEQGFYDRLGFGTGSYEHRFVFDPATLLVNQPVRPPKRLERNDWPAVHDAMMKRLRGHGGCVLNDPELMKAELGFTQNGFGLGYYAGDELTNFFWGDSHGEYGPYEVGFIAYRNVEQLMELLALIQALGDQVSAVEMLEPPELQLQDLLKQPFRMRRNTRSSPYANVHRAVAFWQLRVLDLAACVAKRSWVGPEFSFTLALHDPIADYLEGEPWRGVGGDYTVTIGRQSAAEPGGRTGLPRLEASVGAFTRLLFGIGTASGLAATDRLQGPKGLLDKLDEAFCLPVARTTWDF